MTKQQLADGAGVTVRTLMNWCRPYRKELTRMGLKPGMRVLPPHIVKWIADRFCSVSIWKRSHTAGYVFLRLYRALCGDIGMSLHEAEIAVSKYCTFANAFDQLHYV